MGLKSLSPLICAVIVAILYFENSHQILAFFETSSATQLNDHVFAVKHVLIDFSLTVKAATSIFISGVVRLFHLLRKGNGVLFIIR